MIARFQRQWIIDAVLCLLVLGIDRLVKEISLAHLILGIPCAVVKIFGVQLSWTLVYNQGAAWGMFGDSPEALLAVRCIFIFLLIGFYTLSKGSPLSRMAIALIFSGALGNIIDSFAFGHVIDMIQVNLWGWNYPVFNVADMSICIGVVVFAMSTYTNKPKNRFLP